MQILAMTQIGIVSGGASDQEIRDNVEVVTTTTKDLSSVVIMGFAFGSSLPMIALMTGLSYALPMLIAEEA